MAYKVIYKKHFQTKLFKLLYYLKTAWGEITDEFIVRLQKRLHTLSKQPYIGSPSSVIKSVRSNFDNKTQQAILPRKRRYY